ncbi:MAG: hypothetical protein B6U72_04850 [Candidatus Altiarchaeales archaeon ex4484_2]|nr:MAG: hypothetical protein B6U72_04850 [Candidatus Altiarchaeales archaeon ex4484_2]
MFFLWIALKSKRITISQLYLFGVLFGLYESWITKVLWAGYMESSAGPGFGTFFGIAIPEFLVLVFFWHPVMSFILPILVFEILTRKVLTGHEPILIKTTRKTVLITLFLILISTFIAKGNGFDPVSANCSLIGTLLIISGLCYLTKEADLTSLDLGNTGFILLTIYLFLLYVATFFYLLPERIPTAIASYTSIISFYVISILLLIKSNKTTTEINTLKEDSYSITDLIKFMVITVITVNIACLIPDISTGILAITYLSLTFMGTIISTIIVYDVLKQISTKNMGN